MLPSPKSDCLARHSVIPAEEFLVGEHHARQVQRLQLPFAMDREHAHALQHVTVKVPSFQAIFSRQFRRTDVLEAPRWENFVQRELRLGAVQRPVWPHCTHFAWLSSLLEPLAQLSNVLRCSVNATTRGVKVPAREQLKEQIENCSSNHHHHHRDDQLTSTRRDAQKNAPDNYSAIT